MRIAVIGAAGRLGRSVVTECRRRGHSTVGLARDPERIRGALDIELVGGDARDATAVAHAVANAAAVIVTISGGGRSDPNRAAQAARTITAVLRATGVGRLVVTSAYPIVGRRPALTMALLRRIFASAYADAAHAEAIVAASALNWTIVRLNRLVDRPAVGPAHVSEHQLDRPTGLTRADAATLLVDLAESERWSRVAVNVRGYDGS